VSSPGPSHILPVLVGDAALAKAASDKLLTDHDIYVQSINYPTVAVGEERLRITVTPRHTLEQMDKLVRAVDQVFTELEINRISDWKAAGGRAGVGMGVDSVEPIWTDDQLGITNGTTPRTLRNGQRFVVDPQGVAAARDRFNVLLGPMSGALQANRPVGTLELKTGAATLPLSNEELKVPMPALVAAAA